MGGGEHGPAFLSETKKKPQPSTSSVPGRLFHPSIPAGAGTQEQATGSPPLPESLWVTLPPQRVPTAPQHRGGAAMGACYGDRSSPAWQGSAWVLAGMHIAYRAVTDGGGSPLHWGARAPV